MAITDTIELIRLAYLTGRADVWKRASHDFADFYYEYEQRIINVLDSIDDMGLLTVLPQSYKCGQLNGLDKNEENINDFLQRQEISDWLKDIENANNESIIDNLDSPSNQTSTEPDLIIQYVNQNGILQ